MLPEYGGKLYDLTYRKYPTCEDLRYRNQLWQFSESRPRMDKNHSVNSNSPGLVINSRLHYDLP